MKIRIEDIGEEGLEIAFKRDERWGDYLPPHETVAATLVFIRQESNVLVRGDVEVIVHLQCSRCLVDIDVILNNPIDSVLIPQSLISQQETSQLNEEDMNIIPFDGTELNVDDIVQEHLILSLPFKPLCRAECEGICPRCGVDRNIEPCRCKSDQDIHPFEALKKLKIE